MSFYIDQLGREVEISPNPQRVISLVPSQTEFLYDIGLGNRLVGLTKFCIHPEHWLKEKTVIGGTKNFRMEVIEQLQPDLVIGNKEENYQEGIEALSEKYPVWMSDIYTLEDAYQMMNSLGVILGLENEANEIVKDIRLGFGNFSASQYPQVSAVYLIWRKPYMAVGPNTFIDHLLRIAGFQNMVPTPRYPELSIDDLIKLSPEQLLLSSEPYPFKEKHIEELQQVLPETSIRLVDGELFSWYGSRLRKSAAYFKELRG